MRRLPILAIVVSSVIGCAPVPPPSYNPPGPYGPAPMIPNPVMVPVADRDFTWDQIVDVVDDYFKVEREERVRVAGEVLVEGRIDTYPQSAATLLEPWRDDSVTSYDRLEATLQSIRRRAFVRVSPTEGGYLVEVNVIKELEDVPRPEHATTGGHNFRHDNSIRRYESPGNEIPDGDSGRISPVGSQPRQQQPTNGWIPQGRDANLENEILAKIYGRLGAINLPQPYAPAPSYAAPGGFVPNQPPPPLPSINPPVY